MSNFPSIGPEPSAPSASDVFMPEPSAPSRDLNPIVSKIGANIISDIAAKEKKGSQSSNPINGTPSLETARKGMAVFDQAVEKVLATEFGLEVGQVEGEFANEDNFNDLLNGNTNELEIIGKNDLHKHSPEKLRLIGGRDQNGCRRFLPEWHARFEGLQKQNRPIVLQRRGEKPVVVDFSNKKQFGPALSANAARALNRAFDDFRPMLHTLHQNHKVEQAIKRSIEEINNESNHKNDEKEVKKQENKALNAMQVDSFNKILSAKLKGSLIGEIIASTSKHRKEKKEQTEEATKRLDEKKAETKELEELETKRSNEKESTRTSVKTTPEGEEIIKENFKSNSNTITGTDTNKE